PRRRVRPSASPPDADAAPPLRRLADCGGDLGLRRAARWARCGGGGPLPSPFRTDRGRPAARRAHSGPVRASRKAGVPALSRIGRGIVETGEDLSRRAAAEAMEEAGLLIEPSSVELLGPAVFPTPGMCAEVFHFVCCEVAPDAREHAIAGDGSPFEEGARLEWAALEDALARCGRGEIRDMKTEIGLRRVAEKGG